MNRGSLGRFQNLGQELCPSMRPRFMNRGSTFPSSPSADAGVAFNEAPIHESGKSGRSVLAWRPAAPLQ